MSASTKLLFLPGAGASPLFWRPLGDRLFPDRPRVYFGWPGLGHEPHDPAVRSIDDLVAMVERELADEPADLLAQSMGGLVALKVALRHPKRVRRLVLAVTAGGMDAALRARELFDWRINYAREYPNAARWIGEDLTDLTAQLPALGCPALLLFGDADPIAPPFVGERLASLLPNARLHIVAGGEHDLAATRVDEVLPLIAGHLA